jgi:AGZA family xanthine/uracil permease-like MFS transporter
LIPHVAVAPLLVFVGVVITTQAFTSTPREHAPAVAVALIPHIASLLALQVSKTATTVQQIYETTLKNHQIFQDAPTQLSGLIDSSSAVLATQLPSSLLQSGIHYSGEQLLAYGAIITGLIWGAITALLIDRKFYQAGAFSFAAAVLTLFGIVHAAQLGWYFSSQIFYAYLIMTLMFLISGYLKLERDEEIAASL